MTSRSLAIGTAGPLSLDLPDWNVRFDARIGRPLAEGLSILAGTALPSTELPARTVLAFSLFTNDPPAARPPLPATWAEPSCTPTRHAPARPRRAARHSCQRPATAATTALRSRRAYTQAHGPLPVRRQS
jgi:hypothetical protein